MNAATSQSQRVFVMLILFRALATSIAAAIAPLAVNRVLFVFVWIFLPTSLVLIGGSLGCEGSENRRLADGVFHPVEGNR